MKSLPPDAFAALAIALALLLEWVVPVHILPPASPLGMVSCVGVLIALVGFGLEAVAARALSRAGTTTRAGQEATVLVTSGPFARSRNPFYVGLLLLLAGVVVAFSLDWGIVAVPLVWVALDPRVKPGDFVVPREEAMLRERFAGLTRMRGGCGGGCDGERIANSE